MEKGVGDVFDHAGYGVAENDASGGDEFVDAIRDGQDFVVAGETAVVVVADALFVEGVEFVEAQGEVGRDGTLCMEAVEVVEVGLLLCCSGAKTERGGEKKQNPFHNGSGQRVELGLLFN